MKTTIPNLIRHTCLSRFNGRVLAFMLTLMAVAPVGAAETGKTFATPEEAVAALTHAVNAKSRSEIHALFGPAVQDLINPDTVQAENDFDVFAAAFSETNRLLRASDTRRILAVGRDDWPFSVPIVEKDGRWWFDTAAGVEELLARRIGRNELTTLEVMRTYVQVQREYASRDRDGDQVLEYAQKFISRPGLKDGLFWPPDLDGELSPLGPLAADAAQEGYRNPAEQIDAEPHPFHGYFFKILTRQGKQAPGGKHDYVINGNMIAGFALVAWPAEYGNDGIMTFIVNQQGRVYQSDLGSKTAKIAKAMKEYNPDHAWTLSQD